MHTVAIVFLDLRGYHCARIRAAAEEGRRRGAGHVLAVQVTGAASAEGDFAWRVEEIGGADLVTLFPRRGVSEIRHCEITREMVRVLTARKVTALALCGYARRENRHLLAWARGRRMPCVLMSETNAFDSPRRLWREVPKRWLVRGFDAALVGAESHRDYLSGLGLDAGRIFFRYNIVDNSYFERRSDEIRRDAEMWRSRLQLPARYFVSVSRFVAAKNLLGLLEAYSRYRATSGSPWDLVLCGGGPDEGRLRAAVARAGLVAAVHFPGFQDYASIPPYYALAGGFVLASTYEPWGLVVNEAMAAGVPVVVSRRAGSAALVRDGQDGFVFDPASPAELTRLMARLAADSQMASRLGEGARARVNEVAPPSAFGKGLWDAVECAERRPRGAPSWPVRIMGYMGDTCAF